MSGNVKKFTNNKGYESLNRNMLQDVDNLSLQAIGLLSNLTSMPDNWTLYKTELYRRYAKNGRTSVQNAWNELVENNYIVQLRRRNGKKYEYIYYHSQEKFTEEDIKEIEKAEGCHVWDGKVSNKKKKASTVENQQPKNEKNSTVDFQQSKMDSPKPTDMSLTTNEVNHKDLDTIDTEDTGKLAYNKVEKMQKMTAEERDSLKEIYMRRAFYENTERIPEKLSDALSVFSNSTEQAEQYYKVILTAKNKASKDTGELIWLEDHEELIREIINTFSRSVRKIERNRNINNPEGYIYNAIYNLIIKEINHLQRKKINPENGIYYNWLESE